MDTEQKYSEQQHLVALEGTRNGEKWAVLDLPANAITFHVHEPRFTSLFEAERYMLAHFANVDHVVDVVFASDLKKEMRRRRMGEKKQHTVLFNLEHKNGWPSVNHEGLVAASTPGDAVTELEQKHLSDSVIRIQLIRFDGEKTGWY